VPRHQKICFRQPGTINSAKVFLWARPQGSFPSACRLPLADAGFRPGWFLRPFNVANRRRHRARTYISMRDAAAFGTPKALYSPAQGRVLAHPGTAGTAQQSTPKGNAMNDFEPRKCVIWENRVQRRTFGARPMLRNPPKLPHKNRSRRCPKGLDKSGRGGCPTLPG
jgi:hypothetical protein